MKFSPLFKRTQLKRSFRITRFCNEPARDVDDEIRFHMDCRIDELVEQGWRRGDAEREVRKTFGDEEKIREQCLRLTSKISRRRRLAESISSIAGDIKLSLRE